MSDPTQSNVVYLANFDGADGDTIYWPEISPQRPVFNGDAQLDNSVTIFSNTTAYVDGAGDSITWGIATDCQFLHDQSTDYTLEIHARRPTLAANGVLLSTRGTGCGVSLEVAANGAVTYSIYGDSALMTSAATAAGVVSAATMAYIKVVYGVTLGLQVFIDGVDVASGAAGTVGATIDTNLALTLGTSAGGTTDQCAVNYGPIRITSGEALADLDVPADVFPYTPITYDPYAGYLYTLANFIAPDGTDGDYVKEIGGYIYSWSPGATFVDNSILFNGVDEYITYIYNTQIKFLHDGLSSWLFEIVINASSQQTAWVVATFGHFSGTFLEGFGIQLEPSAVGSGMTVRARVQDSSENTEAEVVSADDAVLVGVDAVISVRYELGVGFELFIDGISAGTDGTFPSPTNAIGGNMRFGFYDSLYYDGYIKNIRIYEDFAKPTREIIGNQTLPFPGFQPSVVTGGFICDPGTITGVSDFSALVADRTIRYTMELSGTPNLQIPISTWQGNRSTDTASYAQCYIPNVENYVTEVKARYAAGERFIIYRKVTLTDGTDAQIAVGDAPIQGMTFSQTTSAYSCFLSGYGSASTAPVTPTTYTLEGVMSVSQNSNGMMRVRASIDWLLTPGDIVEFEDVTFTCTYITYYTNNNQTYMEVGER